MAFKVTVATVVTHKTHYKHSIVSKLGILTTPHRMDSTQKYGTRILYCTESQATSSKMNS